MNPKLIDLELMSLEMTKGLELHCGLGVQSFEITLKNIALDGECCC